MTSSLEAREALSKMEGVIRVHAFGHNGKALVVMSDKKGPTKDKIEEALKPTSTKLRLRKMDRV
jgi:hypothetical protein